MIDARKARLIAKESVESEIDSLCDAIEKAAQAGELWLLGQFIRPATKLWLKNNGYRIVEVNHSGVERCNITWGD